MENRIEMRADPSLYGIDPTNGRPVAERSMICGVYRVGSAGAGIALALGRQVYDQNQRQRWLAEHKSVESRGDAPQWHSDPKMRSCIAFTAPLSWAKRLANHLNRNQESIESFNPRVSDLWADTERHCDTWATKADFEWKTLNTVTIGCYWIGFATDSGIDSDRASVQPLLAQFVWQLFAAIVLTII